ncbi:conserved hypothetical protein [Talaromyces stipitatus ATCC 10500]|uniref:Uncharacterized protein n=1 Tax=Talaromyces stipitatus (strain ATCC 10500 / CBS 375.48 / QM 6759 / NRRL 1006) TaxID=441959 RepID=B8MF53_TALSN|nr:uncharacterized protein TSTA_012600 [Talaromyces stipitatus ATCC 10500]EED16152.1 conserved hypothetical protein [Talaromyces stipitatus ATCC 10500]
MASNTTTSQPQQHQPDFHPASNPHIDHINYTTSENQLAGLVQAATAAAGQADSDWATAAAAAAAAGHHHLENYSTELHLPDDGFDESAFGGLGSPAGAGRQNRASIVNGQNAQGLSRTVSKKRKRGDEALDPALTGMPDQNEQHQQPQQQSQQVFDGTEFGEMSRSQSLTDARAAGVHSAAALFRQPSSNKKYTRPPMSRLYASLELSPENFLHLQAAAKSYMLDDAHPDRRDCVGQRGKGDTEMVKLRLWNCVRDFLEVEGYGERFFGEHVVNEGMPPRQYIWPRDQHKIISLVIPLLRRMVTNERQRQYAIETRKGGAGNQPDERKRRKTEDIVQAETAEQTPTQESHPQTQQAEQKIHPQNDYQNLQNHYVPPPPPLPHQDFSSGQQPGIGLSPLVLEGYPTDWDAVSQAYNMYNQNYQLDTLWGVSGLQQPDWWGLVAAVDSHWKVVHDGNPTQCAPQCEAHHLNTILSSSELFQLDWRIGGSADAPARTEFANSVTRDLDRIIKESLIHRQENAQREPEQTHTSEHAPFLSAAYGSDSAQGQHAHPHDTSPITLHLNVLHDGKRILPRLDVTAEQCPDLASVRNLIAHRWTGQFPASTCDENGNVVTTNWKIQVWLPEGLVTADNDGDWTIAQLSAGTIDWMDNDLRVIVDLGA